MSYGDCNCEFPRCGNGRCIGSHFCPKHLKTPFKTKAEMNAYRRGQRDGRAEVIEANAAVRKVVDAAVAYRDACRRYHESGGQPNYSTADFIGPEQDLRRAVDAMLGGKS